MSKVEIFEDGYLKSEFINPNYRGLSEEGGWPCIYDFAQGMETLHDMDDERTISAIMDGTMVFSDGYNPDASESVSFKQFTPKDIPVGELCWINKNTYAMPNWELHIVNEHHESGHLIIVDGDWIHYSSYAFVPYLIAETAERAEELKDWWK